MKTKLPLLLTFVFFSAFYSHIFAQTSCCSKPDSLKVTKVTDSSVCLKWRIQDTTLCDTPKGYQVQVKLAGSTTWHTRPGNYAGGKYFTGCDTVNSCTNYNWRVRNICIKNGDTIYTAWVNGPNFKTLCDMTHRVAMFTGQSIRIHPNPAYNKIIVQAIYNSTGSVKVVIADKEGKRFYEKVVNIVNNKIELSVDISRFPVNMYFVILSDGSTVSKTTFLKQ